jgi:hypothetical protein
MSMYLFNDMEEAPFSITSFVKLQLQVLLSLLGLKVDRQAELGATSNLLHGSLNREGNYRFQQDRLGSNNVTLLTGICKH